MMIDQKMRIFNRLIVWFLFIFATSGLYAQEFSERNNLIGTELLSLAFGGYLGHYSSISMMVNMS